MRTFVALAASMAFAGQAVAADLILYPVQVGPETIRYRTGIPALNIEMPTGVVTVTPLPLDHNHATFGVAACPSSDKLRLIAV